MPQVQTELPAANGAEVEARSPHTFWALTLGSMGVVFGDIGTSPLYAFRVALDAAAEPNGIVTREIVLGVLSLILWALILVVTCKYVLILLRADNKGEGGTLSLMALAQHALGQGRIRFAMLLLGMLAASLFYGDALITPAISVLSAVEGLEVATPELQRYVEPLTVLILVALFALQSRGTARVASFFGPVMTVWFVTIAAAGLTHIADDPGVLAALTLRRVSGFSQATAISRSSRSAQYSLPSPALRRSTPISVISDGSRSRPRGYSSSFPPLSSIISVRARSCLRTKPPL